MNTWWALCRREWLEHQRAIGWTPLIALGLLVGLTLLIAFTSDQPMWHMSDSDSEGAPLRDAPRILGADQVSAMIKFWCQPLIWLYWSVSCFVLLGSLFDERNDGTILFWKSMPTSDTQVVLSKLFVIVGMGALISLVTLLLSQSLMLGLVSLTLPDLLGITTSDLLAAMQPGKQAAIWIFGYFTQLFWSLPLWGWLMLVSSTAARQPILRALLIPAIPMLIEWAAFSTTHLLESTMKHVLLLPLLGNDFSGTGTLTDIAALWTSAGMWLGIVTGAVFIVLTIHIRRRSNEL